MSMQSGQSLSKDRSDADCGPEDPSDDELIGVDDVLKLKLKDSGISSKSIDIEPSHLVPNSSSSQVPLQNNNNSESFSKPSDQGMNLHCTNDSKNVVNLFVDKNGDNREFLVPSKKTEIDIGNQPKMKCPDFHHSSLFGLGILPTGDCNDLSINSSTVDLFFRLRKRHPGLKAQINACKRAVTTLPIKKRWSKQHRRPLEGYPCMRQEHETQCGAARKFDRSRNFNARIRPRFPARVFDKEEKCYTTWLHHPYGLSHDNQQARDGESSTSYLRNFSDLRGKPLGANVQGHPRIQKPHCHTCGSSHKTLVDLECCNKENDNIGYGSRKKVNDPRPVSYNRMPFGLRQCDSSNLSLGQTFSSSCSFNSNGPSSSSSISDQLFFHEEQTLEHSYDCLSFHKKLPMEAPLTVLPRNDNYIASRRQHRTFTDFACDRYSSSSQVLPGVSNVSTARFEYPRTFPEVSRFERLCMIGSNDVNTPCQTSSNESLQPPWYCPEGFETQVIQDESAMAIDHNLPSSSHQGLQKYDSGDVGTGQEIPPQDSWPPNVVAESSSTVEMEYTSSYVFGDARRSSQDFGSGNLPPQLRRVIGADLALPDFSAILQCKMS